MRARWLGAVATLALLAIFCAYLGGLLPAVLALDAALAIGALAGLLFALRMPWDLYFAARALTLEQDASEQSGIVVKDSARQEANLVAQRLLRLCIAVHVVGAAVVAAVTLLSGGTLGYWFAGSYVLAMGLRPLGAFYRHQLERLRELRTGVRYPRDDVRKLERDVDRYQQQVVELRKQHDSNASQLRRELRALEDRMSTRVSRDETLLTAIRAFLTAVRA